MNQNGRRRSSIEFDTFAGKKVCQVLFELVLMSFRGFLFQKVFNWNALSLQISQETTTIEVAYFGNLVRGVGVNSLTCITIQLSKFFLFLVICIHIWYLFLCPPIYWVHEYLELWRVRFKRSKPCLGIEEEATLFQAIFYAVNHHMEIFFFSQSSRIRSLIDFIAEKRLQRRRLHNSAVDCPVGSLRVTPRRSSEFSQLHDISLLSGQEPSALAVS